MKNALITGANKGIGFETARQLLQNGYYVYLGSRKLENGQAAVDRLKVDGLTHVEAIQLDVTEMVSINAAREYIGCKTGVLDVLINNAGINGGWPQSSLEASITQFKTVFDTNLYGVVRVTQAFIDMLKASSEPRIYIVTPPGNIMTIRQLFIHLPKLL